MTLDGMAVGSLLVTRLQKQCAISNAKILANAIGFNDSPLIGAKKRKAKLIAELIMAETALIICAVNEVYDEQDAKSIIDPFLVAASQSIFAPVKAAYASFDSDYEHRMAEYYSKLADSKPGVAMSFAFIKNLGIDPLKNAHGQFLVSVHFGKSISDSIDALQAMKRMSERLSEPEPKAFDLKKATAALDGFRAKAGQRKAAQQKVDDTTKMLRSLIDESVNGIVRMRWSGRYSPDEKLLCVFHNKAACKLLNVEPGILDDCDDSQILAIATSGLSQVERDKVIDGFRKAVRGNDSLDVETMHVSADKEVWLRLIVERFGDKGDVALTFVDITERKLKEQQVGESIAKLEESNPGTRYDNLFKLKKLLDEGIISDKEYEAEREKLIRN